jgi:parallel beta-helix repeat protein
MFARHPLLNALRQSARPIIFTLGLLLATLPAAQSQSTNLAFVHPGLLQTRQDLEFMKQKVAAGQEPWRTVWEHLLSQRYSALDFEPKAIAHVIRGPYGNPSVGDRDLMNSAKAAYSHALQWVVTGDKAHAQKAIAVINAWSAVLADFHENDAKLLAGWTGHDFCNAAEILRYTGAEWEPRDLEQFKRMLLTVYYPLIKDFFPEANGNWDAAIIDTVLCVGVFCDDRPMFDRAVAHYLRGPGNGGITKYIYPSGQCQESTRDQGHTQLGLGEFALACQVASSQGVDLYGAADNRLALGFEYTAKYMLGESVPAIGTIAPRGRGRFSDIYEAVYQHFHFAKGLEMPWTEAALGHTRTNNDWSALTLYRGPLSGSAPRSIGSPRPGKFASQAGALDNATAEPPAQVIVVQPGQPIQDAIEARAKAGGGWIVLAKGIHTLPAALRIPSGITLAGQGRETILLLDPRTTKELPGTALINGASDLHDVTLRDFVIEGATNAVTSSDPNHDRRQRSRPTAPARAGIVLRAEPPAQMRHLRFEHLTVRNCTLDGVAVYGATQVVITACDFSDNGSGAGTDLHHNLLLEKVAGCQVSGTRLDTSPRGSGLRLSQSRDVTVTDNELAQNASSGIFVSESQTIRVRGNLAEGNDGSGVVFDASGAGCRALDIRDNLSRNNGGYAIEISRAIGGTLQANSAYDNGHPEQVHIESSEKINRP